MPPNGPLFDPLRAHGAWIFLCASVGAGALLGNGPGVERAMLAGTGLVGGFLLASAIFVGLRRKRRQAIVGGILATLMPAAALALDRSPDFLFPLGLAAPLSIVALLVSRRHGFLSPRVIVLGTAALVLAAPVTALAGGASIAQAVMVFGLLWPVCCWRTLRVAASLTDDVAWDRRELRSRGLNEAAYTALWALAVSFGTRLM